MVFKTTFITKLNPEDNKKIFELILDRPTLKRDFLLEAFHQFKKKHSNKNNYQAKHSDIIRMHSKVFRIHLFNDISDEIKTLAANLNIYGSVLIREIICEYLQNNKL